MHIHFLSYKSHIYSLSVDDEEVTNVFTDIMFLLLN